MFWKEWRKLRGRIIGLAGFYFITVILVPLPRLEGPLSVLQIPILLCGLGAGMLLIPAIMGMDAYAGERDGGTEEFLLSKPIFLRHLLLAKFGMRTVITLFVTGLVMLIVIFRLDATGADLFLSTPPYVIWSIAAMIVIAQLFVLAVTMAISVRAPYQSTALIVGGALGGTLAAVPIVPTIWKTAVLQDLWGVFGMLLLGTVMTLVVGTWLVKTRQVIGGGA